LDVGALNTFLLVGALVIVLAVVAVRVSVLFGLPSLVLYLLIGLLLGEAVLGIEFDNAELAQALAFGALALILAEGGLTTRWEDVRPSFRTGLSLATIGVGVSTAVVAAIGHFVRTPRRCSPRSGESRSRGARPRRSKPNPDSTTPRRSSW
jgi:cell volume regulation protein A